MKYLTHIWELVYNRWYRKFLTRCDKCNEKFTGSVLFKKGGGVICNDCHLLLKISNEEKKLGREFTREERYKFSLVHYDINK